MTRAHCPFCDKANLVDWRTQDPTTYRLTPLNPVTPGHLLVVPFDHVPDALANPRVTGEVFRSAAELAARLGGDWNLITSVGAAATQTVKHLHVHLVPRREGDGLSLPWTLR